ncbi:MAG: hypothetical protein R6W77_01315 [Trueperaceae bacterium]
MNRHPQRVTQERDTQERDTQERKNRTSINPPSTHRPNADPRPSGDRGRWPRRFVLAFLTVALVFALTACGDPGISREDADMLREQIRGVSERLDRVEEHVEALADAALSELEVLDDSSVIEELLADARTEVRNAKSELSDLETRLAPPDPDVSLDGSLEQAPVGVVSGDLPGEMPGIAPTAVPPLGQ